jgi:beta-galactosidase
LATVLCFAQEKTFEIANQPPRVGAEIFIEPGQSPGYIDSLFLTLQQHEMKLTRIRLFENYMRKPDGNWDFSLFDMAYRAAEKYDIHIWGNFFPATGFEDVGGFKFPRTQSHLDSVADFIKNCVQHFRQYKSHAGWALLNEIGSAKVPGTPLSQEMYKTWLLKNAWQPAQGAFRGFGFDEQRFLLEHNTWYLQWLASQVKRYDPDAHLHINNHAIFQLAGEYDFAAWRSTLSSFGGSAHASWHFGYFKRNRYPYAVAANSAILHSGAGTKPWLMTELQGGNNTYSGYDAMCPTKEEITQWLWMVIANGGKGAIFWSLNPRAGGYEAGEWAMLDFNNQPSDRLIAAGEVATVVKKHEALLATAKPVNPAVHLLYTRSSLWVEQKMQVPGGTAYEGREQGGVMKSVLGYFETLLEMGVPAGIHAWDEFDFTKTDYKGQVIILAHQISLPATAAAQLEHFVRLGGTLLVDGLTGLYDENAIATVQTGFPLKQLLGGNVLEYKMEGQQVPLLLRQPAITLPGHAWRGYLQPLGGTVLAGSGDKVFALQNKLGKGNTIWWPTLVGLGSRMHGNAALASYLRLLLKAQGVDTPITFEAHQPGMLMQTLETQDGWITVFINKSTQPVNAKLQLPAALSHEVWVGNTTSVKGNSVQLQPEETVVVYWKKK